MRTIEGPVRIDGSFGEGGGQILRSALALSMVTGRPFEIDKIRAGRARPGLMRQHLTAVRAAAQVCAAAVEGDEVGSGRLVFRPGPVKGGDYHWSIGTAGSTSLVLQTVLLPLLLASRPSRVVLEGGTHNPFAPPFDFLANTYLPLINRMGPEVRATLERPGFYPAGGGRAVFEIQPVPRLAALSLLERGEVRARRARASVANLPLHIAERELRVVRRRLNWEESSLEVHDVQDSAGPGNILILELSCENVTEVFTAFGQAGRPAEAVAEQAVQQCCRYLQATAPAGEYLTDQLLLPMALAGSGTFFCTGLSLHARTHVELIRHFLDVAITTQTRPQGEVVVELG
jgi:RNA 3'-terminal phosphate cyclase (ATP)